MEFRKTVTILAFALSCIIFASAAAAAQTGSATGRVDGFRAEPGQNGDGSRPRMIAKNLDANGIGTRDAQPETLTGSVALEKQAFDLINKLRRESGAPALKWNSKVAELARSHSQNMALHNFFSHTGIRGGLVDQRAIDLGLDKWSSIGENIAYLRGFDEPAAYAVERWMMSTSHRRNLLDPRWRESGIGLAIRPDGTHYFTQVFMFN